MQHIMTGVCMYFMLYSAGSFTFLRTWKVLYDWQKKTDVDFWYEIKGRWFDSMLNSSFHIIFFFFRKLYWCFEHFILSFFGKNSLKCGELKLGFVEFLNRDCCLIIMKYFLLVVCQFFPSHDSVCRFGLGWANSSKMFSTQFCLILRHSPRFRIRRYYHCLIYFFLGLRQHFWPSEKWDSSRRAYQLLAAFANRKDVVIGGT